MTAFCDGVHYGDYKTFTIKTFPKEIPDVILSGKRLTNADYFMGYEPFTLSIINFSWKSIETNFKNGTWDRTDAKARKLIFEIGIVSPEKTRTKHKRISFTKLFKAMGMLVTS